MNNIEDFDQRINEKHSINLTDNMIENINRIISSNKIEQRKLFELFFNKLDQNNHTWFKCKEIGDKETPIYYTREPNSFQAYDYSIGKDGNEYIATQIISSIESKICVNTDLIFLTFTDKVFPILLCRRQRIWWDQAQF